MFFWNDSHSSTVGASHNCAHISFHSTFFAFLSLEFFDLFKSENILSEVVSMNILRNGCFEILIADKERQAVFKLGLPEALTLLS